MSVKYILEIGENMQQTVRDVLHFLNTGDVEHRNTTNSTAMEQFLDELDLQEQINSTESDDDSFIGHASE